MALLGNKAAALLLARPLGEVGWVRGLGRSMAPLLRSGDSLKILRCAATELRRGDVAVLHGAVTQLTAHIVTGVHPLRTAPIFGKPDPGDLAVVGKVIAVRREGRTLPLWSMFRAPLWLFHRFSLRVSRSELAWRSLRRARDFATGPWSLPLRRRLTGEVLTRALGADDLERLLLFCADHLPLRSEFLQRQLVSRWSRGVGAAAGALRADGRLCAFAFLDEYTQEGVPVEGFWVRSVFVAPVARGMGLAQQLIQLLCVAGKVQGTSRVFADVEADNAPSLAVFARAGFRVSAELSRQWNVLKGQTGSLRRWVVVEKRLV